MMFKLFSNAEGLAPLLTNTFDPNFLTLPPNQQHLPSLQISPAPTLTSMAACLAVQGSRRYSLRQTQVGRDMMRRRGAGISSRMRVIMMKMTAMMEK